ncbi:hypothetical protein FEM03_12465 [Phragmitibacter flavus]|uniref:Uncharacterized protein n=1 Tax=Phragmitibacter flavus TaxID=2576071 RepID=A0A5R8KE01_9BACT|nr:hypothetical protein [Phragmitibacter flavus]TLD70532.1 hypothetical protein FEM03_12465 [Phragmitibacter flavus]
MNPSLAVYVGPNAVIVAPCHSTPDGILYEQDVPIVLPVASPQTIGAAIKRAFEGFSMRTNNLRDSRKSDWPAFQASGAKSMRQFEAEFYRLSVSCLNPSGAVARAELPVPGDEEFSFSTVFNPRLPDEEIGGRVLALAERVKRIGVMKEEANQSSQTTRPFGPRV